MSSRANLLIIDDGRHDLRFGRYAAQTLTRSLFWGPQFAIDFIRCHDRVEEWLDETWCEGGAVIDSDRQVLTFFGGEDIKYEIELRNFYLRLLAFNWKGWKVRWAHDGIVGLARAAGVPHDSLLTIQPDPAGSLELKPIKFEGPWRGVCLTVDWPEDSPGLYPVHFYSVSIPLVCGPELLVHLRRQPSAAEFTAPAGHWPAGGAHIDPTEKILTYWTHNLFPSVGRFIAHQWQGWQVIADGDNYQRQLDLAQDRIRFTPTPKEALIGELRTHLMWEPNDVPLETRQTILESAIASLR